MEEEEEQQKSRPNQERKSSIVIKIPSYQEVVESSQSKSTPLSLFNPSQSFSQAFSFIKSSEFYIPPPPLSSTSSSSFSQPVQASDGTGSRQTTQSDAPSSSSSASAPAATPSLMLSTSLVTQSRNAILVSHRQKGNPLLRHIRNVRWAFADVVCDYLLGQSSCALYLSLRYHLLHPDYLYFRIRELQKNFKLRIVLCHVDVEDAVKPLLEVTKTALLHDCTLLCAWSLEECGRYLETIKIYENKPADIIQGQMDTDYLSRLNHALTTVRHVNKTNVVTLGTTFGVCCLLFHTYIFALFLCAHNCLSVHIELVVMPLQSLSHIMDASMEDLARCPGIGERKVKRLYDTFHEPFKRVVSSRSTVPDTPIQDNGEPCSTKEKDEDEDKDKENASNHKKEPEVTVKSALSAAFAKYTDKVGKKNNT
ncbi:DNA excision repair protein ERCC-1-like isoform X1 [Juglans regia]|uniref:DNA excision repair protein ERCC-1-like isoform X1 n=1 Tax=Juglans regia TaxID=51240 RepID=A0A6P9DU27_JUGRE|nr:DNA excision repair protein ERCC-1-like isoform X1 [Juglans regia]